MWELKEYQKVPREFRRVVFSQCRRLSVAMRWRRRKYRCHHSYLVIVVSATQLDHWGRSDAGWWVSSPETASSCAHQLWVRLQGWKSSFEMMVRPIAAVLRLHWRSKNCRRWAENGKVGSSSRESFLETTFTCSKCGNTKRIMLTATPIDISKYRCTKEVFKVNQLLEKSSKRRQKRNDSQRTSAVR